MGLINKIGRKTKTGLAVLVGAGFLSLGSMAYAKEINQEGWPLPDETEYKRIESFTSEISGEYEGKKLKAVIKADIYINEEEEEGYQKLSIDDKPFLYIIAETPTTGYMLVDRDDNGTYETKYNIPQDMQEYAEDGLPEWVLKELVK